MTTLPSGNWMESVVSSSKQNREPTDTNSYLVIFSDDGRTGASNQSYLGKVATMRELFICVYFTCQNCSLGVWDLSFIYDAILTQRDHLPLPIGQAQPAAAAPERHDHRSRRRRASPGFLAQSHSQPCQRVPLFVDFEEIGWSGWIISPRGYNAYHCKGSCPFPLGGSLRATNHATVRSIMHALKLSSDEVGAPCCVPDRLQSISLLYFDDEENVVLKQYDDMVALSCGCHWLVALFNTGTMRDGEVMVCSSWLKHCIFVHMFKYCIILRNKTTIPQVILCLV